MGVTRYVWDPTQGPYCALAAGAATVYRNYFMQHPDGTLGQLTKEVQLLENTPIGKYVQHGYPLLQKKQLDEVANANWDDLNQFSIGLHENCEVTTMSNQGSPPITTGVPVGRIVHHVYAAAFDFAGNVVRNETSLKIGGQLLKAEYQATVLAGWEMSKKYPNRQGSKRLVLTALGGGVFGNPYKLIIDAVESTVDLIRKSGLDVYFVCYDSMTFKRSVDAGLKNIVDQLGGRIIVNKVQL